MYTEEIRQFSVPLAWTLTSFNFFTSQFFSIFLDFFILKVGSMNGKNIGRHNKIKIVLLEEVNNYWNPVFQNDFTSKDVSLIFFFPFLNKLYLPLRCHMSCLLQKMFCNVCGYICNYRSQFLRSWKEFVGSTKHCCCLVTIYSFLLS